MRKQGVDCARNLNLHLLPLGFPLSRFFFPLSLKTSSPKRSLSLFFLSVSHHNATSVHPAPLVSSSPYSGNHQHSSCKDRQNNPCNSNATCHLPAYFSATTDLHFRRHHDQKNHLDLFYTKVLTGTPFVILKNPHFYYGSSSFHAKSRLLFMNNNRVGSGPVWCPA